MKYLITQTVCNREEYNSPNSLSRTIESLKKSGLWRSKIDFQFLMHDTGSTDQSYLDEFEGLEKTTIIRPKQKLSVNRNILNMLYYTTENYYVDYIIYIEDDILVCRNWIENIDGWIKKYIERDDLFASFYFHQSKYVENDMKYIKYPNPYGYIHIKHFYGLLTVAIKFNLLFSLQEILEKHIKEFGDDPKPGLDIIMRDWSVFYYNKHMFKLSLPSITQHNNLESTVGSRKERNVSDYFCGEDGDPKFY